MMAGLGIQAEDRLPPSLVTCKRQEYYSTMERNPLPIYYLIRYVDTDEPIHTDAHPFCNDATCPCYSEEPTIERIALHLPRRVALSRQEEASIHDDPTQEVPTARDISGEDTETDLKPLKRPRKRRLRIRPRERGGK